MCIAKRHSQAELGLHYRILLHKKQCRMLLTVAHEPAKIRVLRRQFTRC